MKVILCTMVLWLVGSAMAVPIPVIITLTAFNHGQWQLGYPYTATIDEFVGVPVMCDDYFHGGFPGDTWQAETTQLSSTDYSLLRFSNLPNAVNLYKEAGWLLMQTAVTPSIEYTGINQVVWFLFDANAPLTDPYAAFWLAAGQNELNLGFPGVDFSKVLVFTPLLRIDPNPNGPQEMMYVELTEGTLTTGGENVPSTPEPGTLVLLAGGLLGVWGRWKLA